jgi:drug/metabolite transporter (DMT)-like permease
MPETNVTQRGRSLSGILWMIAAFGSFSFMFAATKVIAPHYPPLEVASLRGLASLPIVVVWLLMRGPIVQVLRVRWSLQVLRGCLTIVTVAAIAFAFRELPIANANAISFVSPLLVGALSVPLLGERLDTSRWIAVGVGFVGVLVVLRPSGAGMATVGGIAALISATTYALAVVFTRVLARTDSTLSMVFWMVTTLGFGAGALALPDWVPIRSEDWKILPVIGVTGAFGQYAITEALQRAPASIVAPFEYTAIVWGLVFDWLVWRNPPNSHVLIGAALIIASGLYLLRRERVRIRMPVS